MADQSPAWAREIARRVLADALPGRWVHTQGVASQARAVGPVLGWDTDLIEVAAWLHDIGYAPALAVTGFHPLDGARYLRDREDASRTVCALVAHHSGAVVEAAERDLSEPLLVEFPLNGHFGEQIIAITYCDFTTGPRGERRLLITCERKSPCQRTIGARRRRCLLAVFWPGATGPSWQDHWSRPSETTNRGVLVGLGGPDGHSTAGAWGCRRRADQRGAPGTPTGPHPASCRSAAPSAAQRAPDPWARGSTGTGVIISMCGRSRQGRVVA